MTAVRDDIELLLGGGDIRSLGRSRRVINQIQSQADFDELFHHQFHHDPVIAARAADAVEKIARTRPELLTSHKQEMFLFIKGEMSIELKWHFAQMLSRISLSTRELKIVWGQLSHWALNPNESKIVRVNAIQSLYDLSKKYSVSNLRPALSGIITIVRKEHVPSIDARLRRLKA